MPTPEYIARIKERQEIVDNLPLWQARLVWEYGFDRAMLVFRSHHTPARARAALEAERLALEAARWGLRLTE